MWKKHVKNYEMLTTITIVNMRLCIGLCCVVRFQKLPITSSFYEILLNSLYENIFNFTIFEHISY